MQLQKAQEKERKKLEDLKALQYVKEKIVCVCERERERKCVHMCTRVCMYVCMYVCIKGLLWREGMQLP